MSIFLSYTATKPFVETQSIDQHAGWVHKRPTDFFILYSSNKLIKYSSNCLIRFRHVVSKLQVIGVLSQSLPGSLSWAPFLAPPQPTYFWRDAQALRALHSMDIVNARLPLGGIILSALTDKVDKPGCFPGVNFEGHTLDEQNIIN